MYSNVCMQSKAVWFKKRRKRKDSNNCVMFWPGLVLPVVLCQCSGVSHGMVLLHQSGEMCPHPPAPPSFPSRAPAGLAVLTVGRANPGLLLGTLVLSFYGTQAVIYRHFTCLWPFPGFQLCYVIVGFRNQSVYTSACLWRQRRVSSGWHGPYGRDSGCSRPAAPQQQQATSDVALS